jgi:hypothetical protein
MHIKKLFKMVSLHMDFFKFINHHVIPHLTNEIIVNYHSNIII